MARSSGRGAASATPSGMLFSLEVDESPLAPQDVTAALQAQLALLHDSLAHLLRPTSSFHTRLKRDVRLFRDILLAEEDDVDGVVLASKLTAAGYRVRVRQAQGGGSGVAVFSNLRHSFVLVTAHERPQAGVDFIVEPHFREQFAISHPTPRYSGLLAMLPEVMVAPAAQLSPLVQLLCSEMSLAFEKHGLSLPPWRQSKSLISKWLPSKARDLDLSPYASPRAASPEPLFPLACITAAAEQAGAGLPRCLASEAGSGSITPGFSGDDASPRAVLHGASALLLSREHSTGSQPGCSPRRSSGPAVPPTGVRKSLLTSSLAPARRAPSPSPPAPALRRATSPRPQLVGTPLEQHAATPLLYCVASEWQQPAIRTVKMQGQALK